MSKCHFFVYNDEKATEESRGNAGWRSPIFDIENGMRHVITGNMNYIKGIEIGDTAYLYGGGDKRVAEGRHGIYGKGKVVDFLLAVTSTDDDTDGNLKFALIELESKDTNEPILQNNSKDCLYTIVTAKSRGSHKRGYCELKDEEVKFIEDGIANYNPSK